MPGNADPVGLVEIAVRLGVDRATADQWRLRHLLPEPDWTVGGRPAWDWPKIQAWAGRTRRIRGNEPPPGRRHFVRAGVYHWVGDTATACAGCGEVYAEGEDFGDHMARVETRAGGSAARPVPAGNAKASGGTPAPAPHGRSVRSTGWGTAGDGTGHMKSDGG